MTDWAIPQQAKLRYTQLFNSNDKNQTGYLSGIQCRDILIQSGLPRTVLAEIWNLSDIDGDGQLSREEFVLALYLTNHARSGKPLPTELPPNLIPPSYRHSPPSPASTILSNSSSIATQTQQTAPQPIPPRTSQPASSSIESLITTNSFEDKRRENYEKGRAELERRRLIVIEQQSELVKEQLEVARKQVSDLKSKIDAMRSDRDVKMGLLTSLEAQIQAIRDKKSYLYLEEQKLINHARESNLVDAISSINIDSKVEQAKKNQFEELNKLKEALAIESSAHFSKTSELKKELKVLSDEANEIYKKYIQMKENVSALEASTPVYYKALYTFEARNEDELNLNPGDVIAGCDSNNEPGWLSGILNGKTGLFPESYVKKIDDLPAESTTTIGPIQIIDPAPRVPLSSTYYKAIYTFEARNDDELNLNPGDIVLGIDSQQEPGWLSGTLNGKTGLFPEAYVEKIDEKLAGSLRNRKSQSKKPEIATVIADYKAMGPEQLDLEKGQLVLVKRKVDSGWWEGEIQIKGRKKQSGWFPSDYVKKY